LPDYAIFARRFRFSFISFSIISSMPTLSLRLPFLRFIFIFSSPSSSFSLITPLFHYFAFIFADADISFSLFIRFR